MKEGSELPYITGFPDVPDLCSRRCTASTEERNAGACAIGFDLALSEFYEMEMTTPTLNNQHTQGEGIEVQ